VALKAPNDGADDCTELDGNDINDVPRFGCEEGGGKSATPSMPFEEVGGAKFIHAGVDMDGVAVLVCSGLVDDVSPKKSISKTFSACIWSAVDTFF